MSESGREDDMEHEVALSPQGDWMGEGIQDDGFEYPFDNGFHGFEDNVAADAEVGNNPTRDKRGPKRKRHASSSSDSSSSSSSSSGSSRSSSSSSSSSSESESESSRSAPPSPPVTRRPRKKQMKARHSSRRPEEVSLSVSREMRAAMSGKTSAAEAKALREKFILPFKHSGMALKCPELDDEYYLRLQEKKGSHASKSNIDSKEKSLLALQYKVLDIAKPLIYAMESKDSKKQRRAVKAALDLWGVAFYDITKARRKNVLAQLNPNFLTLVDSPSRFSPKEFQSLFGRTFSRSLVTLAGNAATLRQVPSSRGGRGGRGGGNFHRRSNGFNGNRGGGHQNGRSGNWQQHSSQGNGQHHGRGYNNNGGNRNANFQNNSNSNRGGYVSPFYSFIPAECSPEQLIIGGRLRNYARVWGNFTADPWVISSVTEGVRLELLRTPVQWFAPVNPSMNETEVAICNEEVQSLLRKGAIRPVNKAVFISPFFCVPKPKGFRPIINLKALNDCLEYQHFQMEGLATARDLIRKGDWIAKIDLTDAYLTVPLHPDDRKFLQFSWMGSLYEYTCVAFGLASAPRVFTKLMKPLVAYFRSRGVRMVIYLDDILLIAESADSLNDHITLVQGTLESVGFVVNVGKSILVPTQQLEFLGFWLDSREWILSLTTEKIQRIRLRCSKLLRSDACSIRDLQSILGLLSWCIPAIPYAQANYRALQSVFLEAERQHHDNRVIISLPDGALKDLRWWIRSLESSRPLGSIEPDLVLFSDASSWGWGYCMATLVPVDLSPSKNRQGTLTCWNYWLVLMHLDVMQMER